MGFARNKREGKGPYFHFRLKSPMIVEKILAIKPSEGDWTPLSGTLFSLMAALLSAEDLLTLYGVRLKDVSVPEPTAVGIGALGATGLLSRVLALIGLGIRTIGFFCSTTGSTISSEETFTPLSNLPVNVSEGSN